MEKIAVIMAGGSGTRLWPLSKEANPKQFISINDGDCLLVKTIERMCEVVTADRCYIITNKNLLDITRGAVKDLIPHSNIIIEPEKKNTAACIAFVTLLLKKKLGEGIICFVPADGYVQDIKCYKNDLELAYQAAEITKNLVIIGVTPTYPSTGYGYIQIDKDSDADGILTVLKFIEKPDFETAQKLISSGEFLWNGGILVGCMDAIIDSIKEFLPDHNLKISEAIKHIDEEAGNTYIEKAYNEIQNISFDMGVLEKSKCIYAIRGLFDWEDIGSIDALSKTLNSDNMGNSISGRHLGTNTTNSVIVGDKDILVTTIGLDNMIIACTREAILVCPRNKAQDIKTLVEKLKLNGYDNLL